MKGLDRLALFLGFSATCVFSYACGDSAEPAPAERACADISGTWTSPPYAALSVNLDGTHTTLEGLSMTLEITQDDACHFQALNTWSNGTLGGSEHVAGVVHNSGETLSMVEVSEHPEGGSSARVHATYEGEHIAFEYAGHSADGQRAVVFSTYLSRAEEPPAVSCPNIEGSWTSEVYEAFTVQGDGTHAVLEGLEMTLDVAFQSDCTFRGVNSWTNGEVGGSEPVAGVIHSDGETLTVVEFGEHPDGGSTGRIFGRVDGERMEWEYAGIDVDNNRGVVFSALLSRDGTWGERAPCPDLTGAWTSGVYEALVVNDDGTSAELEGLTMTLAVEHQEGCHFRGVNTWSNESAGGSEPVAGVIHTDGLTVTMVEVGEHPEGGSSAVVRGLLVGEDTLHWEYAGVSGGGDKAVVFSTNLAR